MIHSLRVLPPGGLVDVTLALALYSFQRYSFTHSSLHFLFLTMWNNRHCFLLLLFFIASLHLCFDFPLHARVKKSQVFSQFSPPLIIYWFPKFLRSENANVFPTLFAFFNQFHGRKKIDWVLSPLDWFNWKKLFLTLGGRRNQGRKLMVLSGKRRRRQLDKKGFFTQTCENCF